MNKNIYLALLALLLALAPGQAATLTLYGPDAGTWPLSWTPLPSLNDARGGAYPQLDFVGDAQDPAAYWASSSAYFYIRMRTAYGGTVNQGSNPPTFADTLFVYIDVVGWGNESGLPDYAFGWDSKAQNHGLEMLVPPVGLPGAWNSLNMNDIDGNVGLKIMPPDINRTGDGYVRTVDGVATTNFGNTTFVDYAISWSYLQARTTLTPHQTWRIALGSVHDQTDHQSPSLDIAGGALVTDPLSIGWSAPIGEVTPVPEPCTSSLLALGIVAVGVFRTSRKRKTPR